MSCIVTWTPKLHLCTEAHKDSHETVSSFWSHLGNSLGSSPVQKARPKEMLFHPSMAWHLFPARTLTTTLINKPFFPPAPYQGLICRFPFQFLSFSIQTKVSMHLTILQQPLPKHLKGHRTISWKQTGKLYGPIWPSLHSFFQQIFIKFYYPSAITLPYITGSKLLLIEGSIIIFGFSLYPRWRV